MAFFSSTSPLWVCLRTRTDPSPNPNERSLETSAGLAQALCYILAWKRSKQNKRSEWARPFLIVLHFYLSPLILHKAQQPIYPILCKNISLSSLSLTHVVLLINTCILLFYSYQSLPPSPIVSITTYTRADTLAGFSGLNLRNPMKVSSFTRPKKCFLVHRVELKKNRPWRTKLYNENNLSFRRWTLALGEGWLIFNPQQLAVLVMATSPSQSAAPFSAGETLEDIPCRVSVWPYNRNPMVVRLASTGSKWHMGRKGHMASPPLPLTSVSHWGICLHSFESGQILETRTGPMCRCPWQ